jgi:hypothetical protein
MSAPSRPPRPNESTLRKEKPYEHHAHPCQAAWSMHIAEIHAAVQSNRNDTRIANAHSAFNR